MAWRDNLRPGSFRGARFETEGHDLETGRRGQLHQYPGRDRPYFEDLGRKAREFTIEVYVIGDDYITRRDALISECEKSGTGTLVHPYLGTFEVYCTACRISERMREGRMARLSLTFVEAGDRRFPTAATDTGSAARLSADNLVSASTDAFTAQYAADGLPGFVSGSTLTAAGELVDTIEAIKRTAAIVTVLDSFSADLSTLVRDPASLAPRSLGLLQTLANAVGDLDPARVGLKFTAGPNAAADHMRMLTGFSVSHLSAAIPLTTDTRRQEAANVAAFGSLVRRFAFAEEGRQLSRASFDSYQDALARAGDLAERLDSEILATESAGAAFDAMTDLRAAVTKDIRSKAGGLPTIVTRTVREATPAVVLAYDLYADATRDAEIVQRNRIRHPTWINPDVPLETLNQ